MKQIIWLPVSAIVLMTSAAAQPQIALNGVLNAASNALFFMPDSSIAQGSTFTIYGTNLGPSSSPALAYPLETTLGGVSVQVSSGGTTANAIPIFVGPTQVNAILPGSAPTGTATLTVTYNGQTSAPATFQVAPSSFGIFTFNSLPGFGIVTDANNHLFNFTPAHPGDVAIVWGTGIGASPGDDGSAPPPQIDLPNLPVSVYVGTQKVAVTYRGRSVFTGEDQINFVVPSGIAGCYVPVAVQIGDIVSNFVFMPIAPPGKPCPDPVQGNFDLLGPLGTIALNRSTTIGTSISTTDSGEAYFGFNSPLLRIPAFSVPAGTCIASVLVGELVQATPKLDAGPAITISGPHGSEQLTTSAFLYSAQLGGGSGATAQPLFLDAGAYTVSGPGGADILPFSQIFTIPPPLTWTNQSDIAIVDRSATLDVTWTGGDPSSTVQITGLSSGAVFTCNAKTSDQHFTIPAFVLLSLPASSGPFSLSTTSSFGFTASGLNDSSGTIQSTVAIEKNVTYH